MEPEEDSNMILTSHRSEISFRDSHKIQSLVGDTNFIHIPLLTAGLPEGHALKDRSILPGYVSTSIAVYRTLTQVAEQAIQEGKNPLDMKIKKVEMGFGGLASFEGDIFDQLWTPTIIFDAYITKNEDGSFTGQHNALLPAKPDLEPVNLFQHNAKRGVWSANVDITLDSLIRSPVTTESTNKPVPTLPEPYISELKKDAYDNFISVLESLSGVSPNPRIAAAVSTAMIPWYLAGKTAYINIEGLKRPETTGPYAEQFARSAKDMGLVDIPKKQIIDNIASNTGEPIQKIEETLNRLGYDGQPVSIPTSKAPMYTRIIFTGYDASSKTMYGDQTTLDMIGFTPKMKRFRSMNDGQVMFDLESAYLNTSLSRLARLFASQ